MRSCPIRHTPRQQEPDEVQFAQLRPEWFRVPHQVVPLARTTSSPRCRASPGAPGVDAIIDHRGDGCYAPCHQFRGGHVPLSDRPNHFRLGPGRSVPAVGCSPTAPTITPQGRAARHGVHTVSPICTPCPPAGGPAASMRSTRSVCALPQDENPANGSLPSRGTSKVTMDVSHVSPSASPTTSNTPASIFRGCCGSLVVFRRCGAPNSSRSSQPACRVHQPVAHGFGFICALGAF